MLRGMEILLHKTQRKTGHFQFVEVINNKGM